MSLRAWMRGANGAPAFWSSPGAWAARAGPRSPPWRRFGPIARYLLSGPRRSRSTATAIPHRTQPFNSVVSTTRSARWRSMPWWSLMTTRDEAIDIRVDDQRIAATLVTPDTLIPGVLFVHGGGGSPEKYLARARQVAALGCVCLTFNLRGPAETEP